MFQNHSTMEIDFSIKTHIIKLNEFLKIYVFGQYWQITFLQHILIYRCLKALMIFFSCH
jgi:hypothetical protein